MKSLKTLLILIAVLTISQNTISQPDFIWHTVDTTFCQATNAAAADLDGDGDLDIVGAAGRHGVQYWLNLGTYPPTFSEANVLSRNFERSYFLEAADLDGDGDKDIVGLGYVSEYENQIKWWENLYPNFFCHDLTGFPNGPDVLDFQFILVDFDRDGDIDIVASGVWREENYDHKIIIYLNDGSGSFQIISILPEEENGNSVYEKEVIDLDNDNDNDILGASLFRVGSVIG